MNLINLSLFWIPISNIHYPRFEFQNFENYLQAFSQKLWIKTEECQILSVFLKSWSPNLAEMPNRCYQDKEQKAFNQQQLFGERNYQ